MYCLNYHFFWFEDSFYQRFSVIWCGLRNKKASSGLRNKKACLLSFRKIKCRFFGIFQVTGGLL